MKTWRTASEACGPDCTIGVERRDAGVVVVLRHPPFGLAVVLTPSAAGELAGELRALAAGARFEADRLIDEAIKAQV